MTTSNTTTEKLSPIVCFHIGRGGRFHNAGHLSYISGYNSNINHYTDDLFIHFEGEFEISKAIGNRENLRVKFEQCCETGDFYFFEKLGFKIGQQYHFNCGGSNTGLLVDNDGTGSIDIDRDYNTTYCKYLEDCDQPELKLIIDEGGVYSDDVQELFDKQYSDSY